MGADEFYLLDCGFNAHLAVFASFSIHQIVLLLLTIVMCISKDNYVQSIKALSMSFTVTITILSVLPLWIYSILITLSGDVETNPRSKRNSTETFSIFHWNLNSISSDNYAKLFLLKALITLNNFDIISISLTYLDSSTPYHDDNLEIVVYDMVRADHSTNTKLGGFCIYYKKISIAKGSYYSIFKWIYKLWNQDWRQDM